MVKIETEDKSHSTEIFCDAHILDNGPENFYEIVNAELPLFEDQECIHKRIGVVGLMLRANESGREFIRMVPTYPGRYQAGYFVTHGPFEDIYIPESWYHHPVSGEIHLAWSGTLMATPTILSKAGDFVLGGISINPKRGALSPDERRTVRVIGWGRNGSVHREIDVTDHASWVNPSPDVAFMKKGTVYAKRFGKTKIECEYENFVASADIEIGHFAKGERATSNLLSGSPAVTTNQV